MTILPLSPQDTTGQSTAYDSVWTETGAAAPHTSSFEQIMLQQDKLYVVLAVVLIIWTGIVLYLFRTDRKLDRLERTLDERISD